jgi:hypothetical protein
VVQEKIVKEEGEDDPFYSYREGYYYYPRKHWKAIVPPFLSIAITHPKPLFPSPSGSGSTENSDLEVLFPPLKNDFISWEIKGQELYMISQASAYDLTSETEEEGTKVSGVKSANGTAASLLLNNKVNEKQKQRCLKTSLQLKHGYSIEMFESSTDIVEYFIALPIQNGGTSVSFFSIFHFFWLIFQSLSRSLSLSFFLSLYHTFLPCLTCSSIFKVV